MCICRILYTFYNLQKSQKSSYGISGLDLKHSQGSTAPDPLPLIDFYRPPAWVISLSFRVFLNLFCYFHSLRIICIFRLILFSSFLFPPPPHFLGCCLILITQIVAGLWLQRGDPRHCVAYVSKFYCSMDLLTF